MHVFPTILERRWTWNGGDSWQFCDHLRNTEYSDLAVFWERIHTDPKSASSVVLMEVRVSSYSYGKLKG